jgi:hypothetical protein
MNKRWNDMPYSPTVLGNVHTVLWVMVAVFLGLIYLVLTKPEVLHGFFDGVNRFVEWLSELVNRGK